MKPVTLTTWAPVIALAAVAGCVTCPDPATLVGPETIIAEYNANADKAPYLWSRAHVKVLVHDPATGVPVFRYGDLVGDFNGLVMLEKDQDNPSGAPDFLLKVGEPGGNTVFGMGNSLADGLYYLWYRQDKPRAWVGRTSLAGAPDVDIPVNPLRLADVFTVMPLPPLTQLPAVVQRIDTTPPCNYVLTYVQRQPVSNHLLARSEYIFPWKADTRRRLARIEFLDEMGMTAMTAELSDWRSIDTEELEDPPAQPPVIAHRAKLTAWDAKTRNRRLTLEIVLGRAATRFAQYSAACRLENALPADVLAEAMLIDRREPR